MTGGRSRLVAAAVLGAVFLSGAVVGAAAYRYLGPDDAAPGAEVGADRDRAQRGGRHGGSAREGEEGEERERGPTSAMLEILREDVEITPRQEERVRTVLEEREDRAHEVFEGVRERFHRWMDTTVARVKEVLDEEQAAEFERLLEQRLEERRRQRAGEEADSARGGL